MAPRSRAGRRGDRPARRVLFLKAMSGFLAARVLLEIGSIAVGAWRGGDVDVPLGELLVQTGLAAGLWTAHPYVVAILRGLTIAWSFVLAAVAVLMLSPGISFAIQGEHRGWGLRLLTSACLLAIAAGLGWFGLRVLRPEESGRAAAATPGGGG